MALTSRQVGIDKNTNTGAEAITGSGKRNFVFFMQLQYIPDKMEISPKHCKFQNLQKMEIVHENADFSGKTDFWEYIL